MESVYWSWDKTSISRSVSLLRFSVAINDLLQWYLWYFYNSWIDLSGLTEPEPGFHSIDLVWHLIGFSAFVILGMMLHGRKATREKTYNSLCITAFCFEEFFRAYLRTAAITAASLNVPEARRLPSTLRAAVMVFPLLVKHTAVFLARHCSLRSAMIPEIFQLFKYLVGPEEQRNKFLGLMMGLGFVYLFGFCPYYYGWGSASRDRV